MDIKPYPPPSPSALSSSLFGAQHAYGSLPKSPKTPSSSSRPLTSPSSSSGAASSSAAARPPSYGPNGQRITKLCLPGSKNPFSKDKNPPVVAMPRLRTELWSRPGITLSVDKLKEVQRYISSFEYNFTNEQYFNLNKSRPLARILDTARDICKDALPIKCLEAAFLAILLTQEFEDIDRFPVSFKSRMDGHVHRHIVMIVRYNGKFGAIGLSRKKELMYKPVTFDTFADILADFKQSYEKYYHQLLKIKFGLPISHDSHSTEMVCWKFFSLSVVKMPWPAIQKATSSFARDAHNHQADWRRCHALSKGGSRQQKLVTIDEDGELKMQPAA